MKKDFFALFLLTILVGSLLVACDSSNSELTPTVVPNTPTPRPTSTPRPTPEPIDVLGSISDELADAAVDLQSPDALLAVFVEQVKMALRVGDWDAIPFINTITYGVRPFPAQTASAEEARQILSSQYLTDGSLVRFNIPVPNLVDTAAYYQGEHPLVFQFASTGWGVDGRASSVVYIVDQGDNNFAFAGILLDYSDFEPSPTLIDATQPRGTLIQQDTTVSQVDPAGFAQDLFTYDGAYSINPAISQALLFSNDGAVTRLTLASGEQQPLSLGDGVRLSQSTAAWLDDVTAVIGIWDAAADDGVNAGHPALLNIETGALTIIDSDNLMTSPPAAGNGRVVYSAVGSMPQLFMWEGGTVQPLSAETLLALGADPNSASAYSPAISNDGRLLWWIQQAGGEQFSLVLDDPENPQELLSIPIVQDIDWPDAAVWQANGGWAVVNAHSLFPWQRGLWLVNASSSQQLYLGNGSSDPLWASGDTLIYRQWVDGRSQSYQINASTRQMAHLTVDDGTQFVGFQVAPLELVVSAEMVPFTNRHVPAMFYFPEGWEVLPINSYNLQISRGAARLELRAAPRGTYFCVREDRCNDLSDEDQSLAELGFFSDGLNQRVELYAVFDEERRDRILFTDLDGNSEMKAYGFDVRVTLEAIGDYSLTDEDVTDAVEIVQSMWIKSNRRSSQQPFVPDESTLASQAEFSSPDSIWGATAYVFSPTTPEEYEVNRFSNGKVRQMLVLRKRIGNQTWRVRDDVENGGLGSGNYIPLQWLRDELLFTYRPIPDGGGCVPFVQNRGLWRLNLNNGSHSQLLPNVGIYAFTDDQTQFASSTRTGFELFDLESRAKRTFSYGGDANLHIQQLSFNPTSETILILMYVDTPDCRPINQLLMRVDLTTGTSTLLSEHFGPPLMLENWIDNNEATLIDTEGDVWLLDLRSNLFERQ